MKVIAISIGDEDAKELQALTEKPNLEAAINSSIRFTLMHDINSVLEASKS